MNSSLFNNIRNFHYYSSNLILRTEIKNHLGLNHTLLGFRLNKHNNLSTLERSDTILIDNNFKVKRNLSKIIEIHQPELIYPPKNFIWFYNNVFKLQFYNQYQRDINNMLFQIDPSKKNIIKNILNIF